MWGASLHKGKVAFERLGLGALIWHERRVLLVAFAAALVGPVGAMAVPVAAKVVVDQVIGQGRHELLLPIALAAGLGVLIQAGATFGAAQLGALAGQRVVARLRQQLHRHTLRLPAGFFDSRQSGNLVSRIISDTEQVRNLLGAGVFQLASGALSTLFAFAVLAHISWWLTLFVGAVLLMGTLILAKRFRQLHPAFRATAELQASLAGRLTQVLGGIRVVKTCSAERCEAHAFAQDTHQVLRVSLQTSRRVSGLMAALALASGGVSVMLLVLGSQAVAAGVMTLGDLALFAFLLALLSTPLVQAAAIGGDLGRALAALGRVAEVLDLPTEDAADVRKLPVRALAGAVVFEEVSYAYVPGRPVLSRVSFSAPPGSITALAGPNGAGKSTLLALLMGLDAPSEGRILLDGRPLGAVRVREYRRHLGVVLQANDLFDGTLRQNICYGRPRASAEEFRRAVRLAHCDEFVEPLPEGYETPVGERGVRLSGGQRQRVAIARAILADPRILLLDEATSQVDSESERLIQEALAVLCGGRTTLVIAHRVSTIQRADQVLVLRSGAIVERGSYEDSVRQAGRFDGLALEVAIAETLHARS